MTKSIIFYSFPPMLTFIRAYWVSCFSSRVVYGVWFSLCECLMSSVCDSRVNASLRVPEEMQSAVAVAHLTHPSAHTPTMQHCISSYRGLMGYYKERMGGWREREKWRQRQWKEWRVIGRERATEMESGSNKEIQCENKNEGKSVIDTTHCLSGPAGPLFLPKSREKCCIFTPILHMPFLSVHLCSSCAGVSHLAGPLICSCDPYKVRQVKKKKKKGEERERGFICPWAVIRLN